MNAYRDGMLIWVFALLGALMVAGCSVYDESEALLGWPAVGNSHVYYPMRQDDKIVQLLPESKKMVQIDSVGEQPAAVVMNGNKRIAFVLDIGSRSIEVFSDATGKRIDTIKGLSQNYNYWKADHEGRYTAFIISSRSRHSDWNKDLLMVNRHEVFVIETNDSKVVSTRTIELKDEWGDTPEYMLFSPPFAISKEGMPLTLAQAERRTLLLVFGSKSLWILDLSADDPERRQIVMKIPSELREDLNCMFAPNIDDDADEVNEREYVFLYSSNSSELYVVQLTASSLSGRLSSTLNEIYIGYSKAVGIFEDDDRMKVFSIDRNNNVWVTDILSAERTAITHIDGLSFPIHAVLGEDGLPEYFAVPSKEGLHLFRLADIERRTVRNLEVVENLRGDSQGVGTSADGDLILLFADNVPEGGNITIANITQYIKDGTGIEQFSIPESICMLKLSSDGSWVSFLYGDDSCHNMPLSNDLPEYGPSRGEIITYCDTSDCTRLFKLAAISTDGQKSFSFKLRLHRELLLGPNFLAPDGSPRYVHISDIADETGYAIFMDLNDGSGVAFDGFVFMNLF